MRPRMRCSSVAFVVSFVLMTMFLLSEPGGRPPAGAPLPDHGNPPLSNGYAQSEAEFLTTPEKKSKKGGRRWTLHDAKRDGVVGRRVALVAKRDGVVGRRVALVAKRVGVAGRRVALVARRDPVAPRFTRSRG